MIPPGKNARVRRIRPTSERVADFTSGGRRKSNDRITCIHTHTVIVLPLPRYKRYVCSQQACCVLCTISRHARARTYTERNATCRRNKRRRYKFGVRHGHHTHKRITRTLNAYKAFQVAPSSCTMFVRAHLCTYVLGLTT